MRTSEQWIFPGMPVSALLKARPAALRLLEGWGIDPWIDPHVHLDALASAKHMPWPMFEAALAELPDPDGDRDWESASLADLLDHLIADHRDMLDRMVPALRFALARMPAGETAMRPDRELAWKHFTDGLEAHMREEENFLFPRLLHYAYCLRHRGCHPDFDGGSVNVYVAIRLLGNEHRQKEVVLRFLEEQEAQAAGSAPGSPERESLVRLLAELRTRLERHNRLEEAILYPKARDLEKSLYDAAIAGTAAASPASWGDRPRMASPK
jgi:iron-sulfur cluster repair protein YtfE (RIC family)